MMFTGKLAFQQRVIPGYRAPFFDLLAQSCEGGLSLFAGQPLPMEGVATAEALEFARLHLTQNCHFQNPQSPLYLCWQEGILNWLEPENPDALIVEANPRYPATRRAIRWMKNRGRPVLGWGLGAPRRANLVERIFRLGFLRSLDGVIAYSRRGAQEYLTLGLNRVFVACNAVSPRPTLNPAVRPLVLSGPPTVLFVGRLQTRKRVDILLRACASLAPAMQPRLIVVGDGPARSELQTLAASVYPRTEFVGSKHGEALKPYFAAADLFALPGTGGLAVQQAMSRGLPILVAQGDGTQNDLVRPENGWQVPPGDQQAFTSTLKTALSDIPHLRDMGAESFRIVREEINLEAMVDAFIAALNELH